MWKDTHTYIEDGVVRITDQEVRLGDAVHKPSEILDVSIDSQHTWRYYRHKKLAVLLRRAGISIVLLLSLSQIFGIVRLVGNDEMMSNLIILFCLIEGGLIVGCVIFTFSYLAALGETRYLIKLRKPSGWQEAFASRDREYVERIVHAIKIAINRSGPSHSA